MTLLEVYRAIESRRRVEKIKAQEKASYDYILADLIGRSMSRIYSSAAHMPPIEEVYPSLFNSEEIQEQKRQQQAELSALRFKQFATSFNRNYKGESKQ